MKKDDLIKIIKEELVAVFDEKLEYDQYLNDENYIDIEKSPINGMMKKQAINYLHKKFRILDVTKGVFKDEYWQPINELIKSFQKEDVPLQIRKTEYYKHDGIPAGKIWWCQIPFINKTQNKDVLYVQITAAGAGSIKDPLDAYDVTVVIN
jgi:hypothetical protein